MPVSAVPGRGAVKLACHAYSVAETFQIFDVLAVGVKTRQYGKSQFTR